MNRDILNKLFCLSCGNKELKLEIKSTKEDNNHEILEGKISCKNCGNYYLISNGILHTSPKKDFMKYEHWDKIYENSGLCFSSKKHLEKQVSIALNDEKVLLSYYSLVDLAKRNNLRVENSIEIGSGSGVYSLMLKKQGVSKEVCLVDSSIQALFLSRKLFEEFGESCNLIHADGTNLPFYDKTFDLSLSVGLIEHFKEKQQKIVAEHCRVAKSVLCSVPCNSISYWFSRVLFTMRYGKWLYGYEKPLTMEGLEELFSHVGYFIKDSSYADMLTSLLFNLSPNFSFIHPVKRKNWIHRISQHEIVVYAIPKQTRIKGRCL